MGSIYKTISNEFAINLGFLAFILFGRVRKIVVWPLLVDFGLFLYSYLASSMRRTYQPCTRVKRKLY